MSTKPTSEARADAIKEALRSYRCQHHQYGDDGGGSQLVDVFTPPGDKSIERGQEELELLADHLWVALERPHPAAPADAGDAMRVMEALKQAQFDLATVLDVMTRYGFAKHDALSAASAIDMALAGARRLLDAPPGVECPKCAMMMLQLNDADAQILRLSKEIETMNGDPEVLAAPAPDEAATPAASSAAPGVAATGEGGR